MENLDAFIAGAWRPAQDGRTFESIDPRTGEAWVRIPDCSATDVDEAVRAAATALDGEWGALSASARASLMFRLADELDAAAEELARTESRDNGKVLREMLGQARGLSAWYRHYAGWADKIVGDTISADKPQFHIYTRREPVGVVAAITAWNSPLLLLAYKLAPALAAGCTLVVKPSELASASTLAFAACIERAGFPAGVFSVVTGGAEVGASLVSHPLVRKVTFTGSTEVGRRIAEAAAPDFKKLSLELGGKSANIVFADADLDKAVNGALAGIFAAGGQTCMAGSRLVVHESIADELVERIVARARTIVIGDPLDEKTELGPLISAASVQRVAGLVARATEQGGVIAVGGSGLPELGDAYFAPTVIDHVTQEMDIANVELFAPVLAVERFTTEEEAIAIADATEFGLVAGIWTESLSRAHRVAARLDAGTVWINAYRIVSYAVPTSGRRNSGYGYENGREALDEYLTTKAVWVNLSDATRDPFTIG